MMILVNPKVRRYLRSHNVHIATDSSIIGRWIEFDDNAVIESNCGIFSGDFISEIGAFSYTWSSLCSHLKIGRYCSIASNVKFGLGDRHPYECFTSSHLFYPGPSRLMFDNFEKSNNISAPFIDVTLRKPLPIIENDVWIGECCVLNNGIKIGTGSVIAAHSVVTRDVPPYSVVGGNPAKLIKMRFSDEIIDGLLSSSWWEYDYSDFVKKNLNLANPESFLKGFNLVCNDLRKLQPKRLSIDELVILQD